jgi:hypothetical protein
MHTDGIPREFNTHAVRVRDLVKPNAAWAMLSNYIYDIDWFLNEIPELRRIPKVVLFHQQPRRDMATGATARADIYRGDGGLPGNMEGYAPPLEPFGTHHSKFLILGYAEEVRVIVITANYHYGNFYLMSDAVWAQVCVCVCVYVYVCVCVCVCVEEVCVIVITANNLHGDYYLMSDAVWAQVCVCMCVYVYVCVCVCFCMFMCVYVCEWRRFA